MQYGNLQKKNSCSSLLLNARFSFLKNLSGLRFSKAYKDLILLVITSVTKYYHSDSTSLPY